MINKAIEFATRAHAGQLGKEPGGHILCIRWSGRYYLNDDAGRGDYQCSSFT